MSEERELEIHGTMHEYEAFLRSPVWRDLSTELRAWIDDLHSAIELEKDINELHRVQGRIEAIRNMLVLPDNVLDALKSASAALEEENG